ncbi:MAG: 30S ribosomal protein S18 [Parcubacteria group bacterium CG07_land_8_20_14_0_80_35_11]|nr:MAG: 30S ribosomal protein S18 [Parcubacteria group bacterium CG07_land_8_20_14_0_80_35_11]
MCYFCQRNTREIDWKNERFLLRFLAASGKIKPRRKTGACALHQRSLKKAVKKAREMAILPFIR